MTSHYMEGLSLVKMNLTEEFQFLREHDPSSFFNHGSVPSDHNLTVLNKTEILGNPALDLEDFNCDLEELLDGTFPLSLPNVSEQNISSFDSDKDKFNYPLSPCDSLDSGVGSPGSDLTKSSESALNIDQSFEILDFPDISEIFNCDFDELNQLSSTGNQTNEFVNDIPLEFSDNKPALSSNTKNAYIVTEGDNVMPIPYSSPVKVTISETISINSPVLPKVAIESSSSFGPIKTTPKSRCGRKSKAISFEEKKQRKRDQNKNAATRYREKKREEAEKRTTLYNSLDTRNKGLKDQVNQISREINYLKDLMIEVYKAKGLIS